MKQKILSILLVLTLILGGSAMLSACEKEKKDYTLKFITTPVNAKDTTAQFPYQISLSNTTFTTTPQKFSQELARTCIVLSSSAYEHDKALDNLNSMGFEHNAKFNYADDYDQNGVGLLISSQKIGKYTLVAVALRGTFQKEWYSNFDIGHDISTTKVHSGFNKACEFSLNNLERYFHNYGIDRDHCKFLITGHSRGAAVANLLAKSLIDIHGSDNVYAYTFATPNTTTNEDYSSSRYKGIFNFVNPEDFISYIPLESWGFRKYGTTITFPNFKENENYEENIEKVKELYKKYKGRELKTYQGTMQKDTFLDTAAHLAPTIKDYYDTRYEIAGLKLSLHEYMTILAHILNEENVISNGLILLSSDSTPFEPLKNYIMSGMDENSAPFSLNYEDSLISYAHTAETYLSWLEVYLSNI